MKTTIIVIGILILYGCTMPLEDNTQKSNIEVQNQIPDTSNSETSESKFDKWDLKSFAEAGIPIKCTARYKNGETESYVDMYIKGENVRIEGYTFIEGQRNNFVQIMKNNGNDVYIHLDTDMQLANKKCYWIYYNLETMNSEGDVSYETIDMDAPPLDYKCEPAVFGDDKFETTGEICDMTAIIYSAETGNNAAYCEYLSGQERLDCIESMSNR